MMDATAPTKIINCLTARDIKASSDRYYENKAQILRDKALNHIKKTGSLPLKSTMVNRNISWEDVARLLCRDEGRNARNPRRRARKTPEEGLREIMSCTSNTDDDNLHVSREAEPHCPQQTHS